MGTAFPVMVVTVRHAIVSHRSAPTSASTRVGSIFLLSGDALGRRASLIADLERFQVFDERGPQDLCQ